MPTRAASRLARCRPEPLAAWLDADPSRSMPYLGTIRAHVRSSMRNHPTSVYPTASHPAIVCPTTHPSKATLSSLESPTTETAPAARTSTRPACAAVHSARSSQARRLVRRALRLRRLGEAGGALTALREACEIGRASWRETVEMHGGRGSRASMAERAIAPKL